MSEKQKTAVEWLCEQYHLKQDTKIIEQAKAMEKEQIIKAHQDGFYSPPFRKSRRGEAEQYYNETFKSENIVMFMTPENGEIESIILTDNPDCGVKGITFKSE